MVRNDTYCTESTPNAYNTNWLSNLSDRRISEITIPGTHDTCCRNTIELAETQAWSLRDQLWAGLRYFDIRCRHFHDTFCIHHGLIYCNIIFSEVLEIIQNFFKENPMEFVVMRIKEEYKAEENTRTFQETFQSYINAYPNLFYFSNNVPLLSEVRGKIFVLRGFSFSEGYNYNDCDIQDYYDLGTGSNLDKKKDLIKKQIENSNFGDSKKFYLNHCSGTGWACYPYYVAKNTNPVPYSLNARMGIIIMDFPGEKLIKHLIDQNKP
jgi:1-phosphatidylinositol phosphodiesterase